MSTMTVTEAPRVVAPRPMPARSLPLPAEPEDPFLVELGRLERIMGKYVKWKDPLSRKIFDWGKEVVLLDISTPAALVVAKEEAVGLVEQLAQKVLKNSFDGSPLLKPCLEADYWVWDQWMVEDYCTIAPGTFSPFTNKPFDVKPHLFALDMLEWARSLQPRRVDKVESKASQVVVASAPVPAEERLAKYQVWAMAAVMFQMEKEIGKLNAALGEGAAKMEAFQKKTEEISKMEAERAEIRAQAHLDKVTSMIDASEKASAATIAILDTDLKDTNGRLTKSNAKLVVAEDRCTSLEASNRSLVQQLGSLRAAFDNYRNSDSGGCVIQ